MPKFIYKGEEGGDYVCTAYGFKFVQDQPVDVPEENTKAIAKLTGNPLFQLVEGEDKPKRGRKANVESTEEASESAIEYSEND